MKARREEKGQRSHFSAPDGVLGVLLYYVLRIEYYVS
jgi:hypothetical protein